MERGSLLYERCPECGSPVLIVDSDLGEVVCENCGFVTTSNLKDRKQEWRTFTLEESRKKAQTGAPVTYTLHDKGLSTVIDRRNRDARGVVLPAGHKAEMYRLRRWHRRIRVSSSRERNLASAMSIISRIGDKLSLPRNVLESSSVIFGGLFDSKGSCGSSRVTEVTVRNRYK